MSERTHLLPRSSEIRLGHPHPSLPQRKQTSLRTHSFDVCTAEVIFGHYEFFEVDIFT